MKNIFGKYCMVVLGLMLAVVLHAETVLLSFYADGVPVLENYETESGVAVTLSSIVSNPANCRGYNFVGWKSGSPVTPGETPTTVTSVTPTVNMNFYAVYQRAGGVSNRYTRITSVRDLRAGSQYLLVCYYDHDGEVYYGPSYFAMKNVESNSIDNALYPTGDVYNSYYDVYAERYSILTEQIFPDGGVYDDPVNSIIWTLDGSEDAWTLTNGTQSLKIWDGYSTAYYKSGNNYYTSRWLSNYNHHILANPGNSFVISSTNGTFNFKANGYYLTYSDDEEDYFKMGESNDWDFYLYKKEDPYTSYPDCRTWTVHLDAVDGTIGNTGLHKQDMDDNGSGVVLPSATKPAGADCDDWKFVGWTPEVPLRGTTSKPKLYPTGSTYKPIYDGEILYAVYAKMANMPCYVRVNSSSEISAGDTCVIATVVGDTAVTNTMTGSYYFKSATVPVFDGKIAIADVPAGIKWRCYTSSDKKYFRNGSTYLSYSGGSSIYYYVENSSSPFYMRQNYSGYYYLYPQTRNGSRVFGEMSTSTGYSYYIYKKSTGLMPISYTSYPHCVKFRVNLHGCGGAIGSIDGPFEMSDEEATIGGGITLPSIVVPVCDEAGEDWTFEGWQEGGDVDLIEDVRYTGLLSGTYVPDRDEIDLYAVFKHKTNKYDIIYNPVNMESGDEYIITGYDNLYDWAISKETHDANHLAGIKTASPKGIEGYYVIVDDLNAVWKMDGTYSSCTFQNVADPTNYLASNNSGYTMTSGSATTYQFTYSSDGSGFSFAMQEAAAPNRYMIFNMVFNPPVDTTSYFSTGASRGTYSMYVYRRIKEYSSWPHCEAFTVLFDKGTGTVAGNITSMSEGEAYEGVTLPNAYANVDCAKEGWTFAGWSTMPVTVESDALSVDLLPAGSHYRIPSDNKTLWGLIPNVSLCHP